MRLRCFRPPSIRPATDATAALMPKSGARLGQGGITAARFGGQTFDQFDDFEALAGRKFKEGLQQPQAFDSFARWSSESLL